MGDARRGARRVVLDLLEQRHGIGARAGEGPLWLQQRLDRALEAIATERGVTLDGAAAWLGEHPQRLVELADVLRVGETCFYRDPTSWRVLGQRVLPRWRGRAVRFLSAGCSTGEEAWTLALVGLDVVGGASGVKVVGVDLSEVALATARAGEYPLPAVRHLPSDLGRRYLETTGEVIRVGEALRRSVAFVARDLMLGPPAGRYALIICRNVLMYLGLEAGRRVAGRLLDALTDDGVLLVARSEVGRVRAMGYAGKELGEGVTVFSRV